MDRHNEVDDGRGAPSVLISCENTTDEVGDAAGGTATPAAEAERKQPDADGTDRVPDADDPGAADEALAAMMVDAVGEGARLCDLHGIPDHVMNGIHAYAYDFYRQGRLDEAEAFFRFLCLYDFYNADYATGLAAVFQLQGRYRQAIDMYGVAMRLGFDDPSPVFYAGQCFLKLGITEDAAECFGFVAAEAHDASLRDRAQAYLGSLVARASASSRSGADECAGVDPNPLIKDGEAA